VILAVALAMAAAFVASYTAALDRPVPRRVPIALVGTTADAPGLAERLAGRLDGAAVYRPYRSAGDAQRAIDQRRVLAALVRDPGRPRLLIAGAEGAALARALRRAADGLLPPGAVLDVRPLSGGDESGLGGFYAMVAATLLGFLTTFQLRINDPRLGPRSWTVATAALAATGGLVLAVVTGPVLGALPAPVLLSWAILATQVLVAALFGSLMGMLLGRWAIVPTWLVFTALGNPASGGPVPAALLPQPWAWVNGLHPDGAAVSLLRTVAYFPDAGLLGPAAVEAAWLFGLLGLVLVTARARSASRSGPRRQDGTTGQSSPERSPEMSKTYNGRCAGGAVTYGFDDPPSFVANCHCTDCKRASGGEMATFALVSESDLTVSGETRGFRYPANTETCAGNGLTRVFCVSCGSRLLSNALADFPGGVFVQQGTLDRLDQWSAPQVEIFTWSRQPWLPALPLPQYDHGVTEAADDDPGHST
jgi:hypothetical protein